MWRKTWDSMRSATHSGRGWECVGAAACLVFTASALCTLAVWAAEPLATRPVVSPYIHREIVRANPPLHLHVVTIDLADPRVLLRVCPGSPDDPDGPDGPWQTRLATVRDVATREKLDVAVNGDFFTARDAQQLGDRKVSYVSGNAARAVSWAMTDGVLWSENPGGASLVVDDAGRAHIGDFRTGAFPDGARQIISGSHLLVTEGRDTSTAGKGLAPRTAAGVSRDGRTLTLLLVDGRRENFSVGMTHAQLARELIDLGCWNALNLDGGGSTTLVMRDEITGEPKVVNMPSDGHDLPLSLSLERPVVNVLGVRVR